MVEERYNTFLTCGTAQFKCWTEYMVPQAFPGIIAEKRQKRKFLKLLDVA